MPPRRPPVRSSWRSSDDHTAGHAVVLVDRAGIPVGSLPRELPGEAAGRAGAGTWLIAGSLRDLPEADVVLAVAAPDPCDLPAGSNLNLPGGEEVVLHRHALVLSRVA